MAVDNVQLTFNSEFEGKMQSPTGELMIGNVEMGQAIPFIVWSPWIMFLCNIYHNC